MAPTKRAASPSGVAEHGQDDENVRPRGSIPSPRQIIVIEDSEDEDNDSLGPTMADASPSDVPPFLCAFQARTPVDRCSPPPPHIPLSAGRFKPLPVSYRDLSDTKDWRLAELYDKGKWPTDPGLMTPHVVNGVRVPRLQFEETVILEEDESSELAGTGVAQYYSSGLPAKAQMELVARYGDPVKPAKLRWALEFAIMKEEKQRKNGDESEVTHDKKRRLYDYEKPKGKKGQGVYGNKRVRFA
ncbi:hypothetical protein QBC34DRAFT_386072 [Podospora aff. communis PSN243]|uniref:Uncharacterized protein n=1 Tax=Podospora aff. communis PSN243 TaxID=3040156 RepID=A0AAV9G974_9PEZI|nr:hypothetical protein QBC34DRAFT_386072 [Podospora aff. communis PSN243]